MILTMQHLKTPAALKFAPKSMSETKTNPFNAGITIYEGDAYWEGELEYKNLSHVEVRAMRVFINNLNGPAGNFWFDDITHTQLGAWAGTLIVDESLANGRALRIAGAVPNTLIAPAGDRFQVGDHLYELLQDAIADSAGKCTMRFLPDLRRVPQLGEALITANPLCKCLMLPKQTPPEMTRSRALLTNYKFKFRGSDQ